MSTRSTLIRRVSAAAAASAAMIALFVVSPVAAAPPLCDFDSTQANCECPTSGAGTTCFGGQLYRASDNSCRDDHRVGGVPTVCTFNQKFNCDTTACQCDTANYPCLGCTLPTTAPGGQACSGMSCPSGGGIYTNVCGATGCPSGKTLCATPSPGSCVTNRTCPAGTTWDVCSDSCITPNVLLSPGWIQNGFIQISGDLKSTTGDVYLANGKAIRVDGAGTATQLNLGNWGGPGSTFALRSWGDIYATDGGKVGIGTTSPTDRLHLVFDNVGTGNSIKVSDYGSGSGAQLFMQSARGSAATPTATATNDRVAYLGFDAYNGSLFMPVGAIRVEQDAAIIGGRVPGRYVFYMSTPTTLSKEVLRIAGEGNVGIGTASPGQKLTVNGDAGATRFLATSGDTAAAPGYSWAGDPNTGISNPFANQMHFSTNGARRAVFNDTGRICMGGPAICAATEAQVSLQNENAVDGPLSVLDLYRWNSAAAGSPGIGGAITMHLENSGSGINPAGQLAFAFPSDTGAFTADSTLAVRTTVNGSLVDRMFIDTAGTIGIGTTTPAAGVKLDVNGPVKTNTLTNGANPATSANLVIQPSAGTAAIVYSTANNTQAFIVQNNLGQAAINADTVNQRLGVNTSAPASTLDVNGTAQMTGFKMATGAAAGRVLTSDATGVGTWTAATGIGGSGTTNYVPKFTAATTLGNSQIYDTGTAVLIGSTVGSGAGDKFELVDGPQRIKTTSGNSGATLNLQHSGEGSGRSWAILSAGSNNPTVGLGKFGIVDASAGAARVVIDSAGNVGIGTNTPSSTLSVGGNGLAGVGVYGTGTIRGVLGQYNAGTWASLGNNISGSSYGIYTRGDTAAVFAYSGSQQVTLASNTYAGYFGGNVGIGTETPENNLHVMKGSAGTVTANVNAPLVVENSTSSFIHVLSPAANEQGIMFGDPTLDISTGIISGLQNQLEFRAGGNTTRMTVRETGNVGIGTTGPTYALEVVGDGRFSGYGAFGGTFPSSGYGVQAQAPWIGGRFVSTTYGTEANLAYYDYGIYATGAYTGALFSNTSSGTYAYNAFSNYSFYGSGDFRNYGTMYNSGYVGVGIASPEQPLHVYKGSAGAVTANGNSPLVVENNTNAYINILAPDASETGILFGKPASNVSGGIVYSNASANNGLQFRTNGNATRMTLDSSGTLEINGNPASAFRTAYLSISASNTAVTDRAYIRGQANHIVINGGGTTSGGDVYLNYTGDGATGNVRIRESLFVTSTGVGIGTTTPGELLHLYGSSAAVMIGMSIQNTGGTGVWDFGMLRSGTTVPSGIGYFYGGVGKMILSTAGELMVNTTTPQAGFKLTVGGTTYSSSYTAASFPNVPNYYLCSSLIGTGQIGTCSSSRRFKDDIRPYTDIDWQRVLDLQPMRFTWNVGDKKEDIGLIAEDVAEVIPELVISNDKGQPESVKYDKMPLFLLEGVKELDSDVNELKKENAELRQRLEMLEKRLDSSLR